MELSARYLREEVEFKERWRGYDPDEVDELLEQIAAGIEQLQEQLRQTNERAERAEKRVADEMDTEGALRRTLVLAQRTAEQVTSEAEETAARMVAEAAARADAIITEVEATARRSARKAQRQLREDIAALEKVRAVLQADVSSLEAFLTSQRARLLEVLADEVRRLEELSDTMLVSPPSVHEVILPPERDVEIPAPQEADKQSAVAADESASPKQAETVASEVPEPTEPAAPADDPEPEKADEPPRPPLGNPLGRPLADHDGLPSIEDHDPFMSELRKAVHDEEPLGPWPLDEPVRESVRADDGAATVVFDQGLEIPDRTRRNTRRRRP